MISTDKIRITILVCLILTGIYVWVLAPPEGGPDLYYTARGAETVGLGPETPDMLGILSMYVESGDLKTGDMRPGGPGASGPETDGPQASGPEPGEPEDNDMPDLPEMSEALIADMDVGYLILVNKENSLERGDKPTDLKQIIYFAPDRGAEGRYLRADAADAFHMLVEAAAGHGMELVLTTGYRSYDFQSVLYNNYVAKDGQAAADRYSAQPGKSEHQTGLAADVSAPSVNFRLTEEFADTEEGRWLADNARHFGFIIRYPKGKEVMTGYMYEPWHIRYVGMPAAGYISEHELTLEEFLHLIQHMEE